MFSAPSSSLYTVVTDHATETDLGNELKYKHGNKVGSQKEAQTCDTPTSNWKR